MVDSNNLRDAEDLQEREARLREITDALPGAVYQYRREPDGAQHFLFLSRGMEDLFEASPDVLNAQGAAAGVVAEDLPAFWQTLEHSARTMQMWDHEYRICGQGSGRLKWLRTRATPRRQPDGSLVWTGVVVDVTERKQMSESLRRTEERYRLLADNASDLISCHSLDGEWRYQSPACRAVLGCEPEEVVGRSLYDRIHPDDVEQVRRVYKALLTGQERGNALCRLRHNDGRYIWMEINARLIPAFSRTTGQEILCVARDVSERLRLEEQVRQVQKMEAMGRLAGSVAHDFSNMLTVINGSSLLLREQAGLPPSVRELVEGIHDAGERARVLTRQLLAFSRKQALNFKTLNLNAVVQGMDRLLARLIGKGIQLELKLDPLIGYIRGDAGRLEQVVLNLVVNAQDAMPGGGRLTLATSSVRLGEEEALSAASAHGGPYVRLTVADTGCGMDADTLAHLFEPFFTTKEPGKGTGLGLATVYGIVRQLEGRILVESTVGQGTTFHIDLPLLEK